MNWQSLVDPALSGQLCLTLLHSVWQVALLAVAARCAQWLSRKRSVELAYAVHVSALVLALAAMPVTWTLVEVTDSTADAKVANSKTNQVAAASTAAATPVVVPAAAALQNPQSVHAQSADDMPVEPLGESSAPGVNPVEEPPSAWLQVAPWIVALYAAGVLVMLARVMAGVWQAQRLVARAHVITQGPLVDVLKSLARKWSMWIIPELAWADAIIVPKVVGLLRPTILLPASAITGLAPDQLEMILAHELAHVRRSDLWVNLVQRVAEAVLFFNPALWYLSRRISTLREYCCDELACQAQSSSQVEPRTRYAMALLRVVELARAGTASGRGRPGLDQADVAALAASGRSPSELRRRVARLFGEPLREPLRLSRRSVWVLVGLVLLFAIGPTALNGQFGGADNDDQTARLVETLKQQCDAVYGQYDKQTGKRLEKLSLWGATAPAFETVAKLTALQDLEFVASDLRKNQFDEIGKLTNLKRLKVINSQFLPRQMSALQSLTNLEHLELMFTVFDESEQWRKAQLGDLTDEEQDRREQLLAAPSAKTHIVEPALLTDRGLPNLARLTKLKTLHLINTFITREGLKQLQPLTAMESLNIGVVDFSPEAARRLYGMSKLRSFRYVDADDAIVAELAKLQNLQELDIWSGDVTDAGAAHLAKLSGLVRLEIRGNQMTDEGLMELTQLNRLQHLDLKYAKAITPEGVEQFRRRLPQCKVIYDPKTSADNQASSVKTPTSSNKKATISGKIVLEDGSPATARGWLYSRSTMSQRGNTSSTNITQSTEGQYSDAFKIEVQPGTVFLSYFPDGFAPAWVGPFELEPGEEIDDVKIVLEPGFSVPLRVINERSEPVSGATVVIHPQIDGNAGGPVLEKSTDERGAYLLEHLADTKYSVRVEAPGYETLRTDPLVMQAGRPIVLTMIDSKPTTGMVRNADGEPAAGAKLYLKHEMPKEGGSLGGGGPWGKLVATADDQGRFELDQLTSGSHYLFVIETADQARLVVHDITAGLQDVQITVPQRRDLIVKLKGDLSKLPQRRGRPFIAVRQRIEFRPAPGKQYSELLGEDAPIEPTEGGGEAVFRGLVVDQKAESGRQQVEVSPGYDHNLRKIVDINPDGVTEVVFEFPADVEKQSAAEPNENALLTARVVDAETGKPIPEFQALAGTSPMQGLGWQWQPHTVQHFKDGQLQWPPAGQRGYDMQVIRIEAEGYVPYQTPPVKKLQGDELPVIAGYTADGAGKPISRIISARPGKPASLEIRLRRDPRITARVLDPSGKPAADAMIAVGMSHREVRLRGGKIIVDEAPAESATDRWSRPRHTRTDDDGRFTLQSEPAPAVVVVAHPSGVAVMNIRDLSDSSQVELQPWGRIEGQVLWNQTPGAGEKISLIAHGDTGLQGVDAGLLVSVSEEATTDADGRFLFELVPPGRAQIARHNNPPGEWNTQSLNPVQHVEVLAGAPTKFVLGGRGRPVIGKLRGRDDWKSISIYIAPNAPRPGFLADPKDPTWPAYGAFLNSAAGKHYVKNDVAVNPDGTFRIEDVPPENYQLFIREIEKNKNPANVGYSQFTIDTIPGGESDEPLDLGTLQVKLNPDVEQEQKKESDKSKEQAEAQRKGPILRGRVVDEAKEPIAEVKVVLYGGLATRFRGQEAKTNAKGEYRFDPLRTGAMMLPDDKPNEYYTGVQFNHDWYVPADGKSWRDIQVPMVDRHEKVLDLAMTRGGKVAGTIVNAESEKPAANLDVRIHNGFIKGDDGTFLVYATTDAVGKFQSAALFPGRYIIEINDNDFEGKYRYPKIGAVDITAGETAEVKLTTRERLDLQDPFQITGTARGIDGKSMVYGGVGVRIVGGDTKLRSRGGGIDGRDLFGLRFGPVDRVEPSAKAPYGVGTHDIEIFGNNQRFGYRLAKRTPPEPLRITDDPKHPELENGVRYVHPNRPLKVELEFVREESVTQAGQDD